MIGVLNSVKESLFCLENGKFAMERKAFQFCASRMLGNKYSLKILFIRFVCKLEHVAREQGV